MEVKDLPEVVHMCYLLFALVDSLFEYVNERRRHENANSCHLKHVQISGYTLLKNLTNHFNECSSSASLSTAVPHVCPVILKNFIMCFNVRNLHYLIPQYMVVTLGHKHHKAKTLYH